jgi:hypothetical protein
MRKISGDFIDNLKVGFLAPILDKVRADKDLDLQVRDGYINIYFKGNSLLKLTEKSSDLYAVDIHQKFLGGFELGPFTDNRSVQAFVSRIPEIKENIIIHGKSSLEIEYEQLIIRANNQEPRNTTEYFIVDRQYTETGQRFDLTGIFWSREGRNRNRKALPALIEVKFALNSDIKNIASQVEGYYTSISEKIEDFAVEIKNLLVQKIDLGLFKDTQNRLDAMKQLKISTDPNDIQIILGLVDYNPASKLLDYGPIKALPFANQIRIFRSGFGMWQDSMPPVIQE